MNYNRFAVQRRKNLSRKSFKEVVRNVLRNTVWRVTHTHTYPQNISQKLTELSAGTQNLFKFDSRKYFSSKFKLPIIILL